ncbi:hydrolase [Limoniibacter endophyticus]|uniref:Hydrolase n=2 Tax=Limoniibacter endophyticus TaxID=1565040 RepID=A0A8J3GHG4_9HYPH|nr:hydrolase [Limoniibacter endophyticus]
MELRSIWRASLPPSGIIRAELLETSGRHRRLRFHYATGDSGEAALLLPEGNGPHPAVLLLHDHGGLFDIGWRKMVAGELGEKHAEKHYDGCFLADDLAKSGFAVLVCDALGWGSRYAGGYVEQQALASQAMQAGWSLAGIVAADDLAAFDWLSRQPETDDTRVAALGFSFGGFRAWQVAALEQRVSACASLSWAGTRAGLLQPNATLLKGQSAFYTLHPSLAPLADFPDMAALAADRPMFLRTGSADIHFPQTDAQKFFDKLRDATHSAEIDAGIFPGHHHCPRSIQVEAIDFLKRHQTA